MVLVAKRIKIQKWQTTYQKDMNLYWISVIHYFGLDISIISVILYTRIRGKLNITKNAFVGIGL